MSHSVIDIPKRSRTHDQGDSSSSVTTRRSRADHRPPIPTRKPDIRPAFSEPSIPKAVGSSINRAPAGLLWKRKQTDVLADVNDSENFHEKRGKVSSSTSSVHHEPGQSDEMLDNTVFSTSNGSINEDLSITSAYHSRKPYFPSDNANFSQGRSSSTEVLNLRSRSSSGENARSGSSDTKVRSESTDSQDHDKHPDKGGNIAILRQKNNDKTATPSKRLSREEIQAALDRADTYLKKGSFSSDEEGSRKGSSSSERGMSVSDSSPPVAKDKPKVSDHIMSKSDSSVHSAGEQGSQLRSWARYRNQRYSRMSDNLDDKVGDVTKLGSISDISVSGYRNSSAENIPRTVDGVSGNKNSDALANIGQSSVIPHRPVRNINEVSQSPEISPRSNDSSQSEETVERGNNSAGVVSFSNRLGESDEQSPTLDTSIHSANISSGLESRPMPVPRRSAPLPPSKPPPPPPTVYNEQRSSPRSHDTYPTVPSADSQDASPSEITAEVVEEIIELRESTVSSEIPSVSTVESELPPVQMRVNSQFLMLEEPEESSDIQEENFKHRG